MIMQKNISFFISSRSEGNENSALLRSTRRIFENAANPDAIDVLVKFDEDDPEAKKVIKFLEQKPYYNNIKHTFGPRWRGYDDLHKGYNLLLETFKPESDIYWVISDDAEILCKNFDQLIMQKADKFVDGIFVMHGSPLTNLAKKTKLEALEKCDPYPIWSRKWIETIGGFGETFSTDGFSSILERELYIKYGLDRRIFIPDLDIVRHMLDEDFGNSEKWNVKRKAGFDHMLSEEFQPRFNKMVDDLFKQTHNRKSYILAKLTNKLFANRYYRKINKKLRRSKRKHYEL